MFDNRVNITTLLRQALQQGRDDFIATHPYPVLVPRSVHRGALEDAVEAGGTLLHVSKAEDGVSLYEDPRVLLLRRRGELGESPTITLGRTLDTDISLLDQSVGKQHALFHRVAGERWELEDQGSKNGTWIDDLRLIPGVSVELETKQALRFGRVHLHFYAPADLYDALMAAAGTAS
jgi:pSer/pThr/pTyr-binding forkhead associated (FHA) protein